MSKICNNCGAMLEDDVMFCTSCGAQYQEAAPATEKAPAKFDVAAIIGKVKAMEPKKLIILGAAAVAAIALIVVLCVVLFANPYKSAIQNYYAAEYGNFQKMESLAPAEYWEYVEDQSGYDIDDMIEMAEDSYKDSDYEDKYGEKVSVTVDVIKEISLPKGQVEKIAEYLDDKYDIDAKKVTAVKKVYYDLTIKSDVYASYAKETYTYVIQISGKWYVISSPNYSSSDDVWKVEFGT